MSRTNFVCVALLAASLAPAQTSPVADETLTPVQQAVAPPIPATTISKTAVRLRGIDFSGLFDGYYSFNNNHPASGFNILHNFNDRAGQIELNLLKLTINRDPDPIGFHIDVGLGRAMQLIHTPLPEPAAFRFIEQAYVSLKPKVKRFGGVQIDLGQFVTSAGSEVIETKDNWNYTRSLLYVLAIPYYHFGLRSSIPVSSTVTAGVQIVNGWNSLIDQHGNNMQTIGLNATIARKKFAWSHNYYVGPQYTAVTRGNRNLYDTGVLLTLTPALGAYVNFDYGAQHSLLAGGNHWIGIAGAVKYQVAKRAAIAGRLERFNDSTGFVTGTRQRIHETTVTLEYKFLDGLLARAELRHDGSNVPFFDHGLQSGTSKTQTTVTVGLLAMFPVKR